MRTKYDKTLDENTINVGKQLYEKMISGMYLGELVRVVLESLTRDGNLFDGDYDAIEQKGCFPTKYVSEIEAEMQEDSENQFAKTQQILEEIGILGPSPNDCANVAYVCTAVSTRAAFICAAGIASESLTLI
jgi:hexokinase